MCGVKTGLWHQKAQILLIDTLFELEKQRTPTGNSSRAEFWIFSGYSSLATAWFHFKWKKNRNRTDIEGVIDANVYIYYTCLFYYLDLFKVF